MADAGEAQNPNQGRLTKLLTELKSHRFSHNAFAVKPQIDRLKELFVVISAGKEALDAATCQRVYEVLVPLLDTGRRPDTARGRVTAAAFAVLADLAGGRHQVALDLHSGGILKIILSWILSFPAEVLLENLHADAVLAAANLLVTLLADCCIALSFREMGGVSALLALVPHCDHKIRGALLRGLQKVAVVGEASAKHMLDSGALPTMLELVRSDLTDAESVLAALSGIMAMLPSMPGKFILNAEGAGAVMDMLDSHHQQVRLLSARCVGTALEFGVWPEDERLARKACKQLCSMLKEGRMDLQAAVVHALRQLGQDVVTEDTCPTEAALNDVTNRTMDALDLLVLKPSEIGVCGGRAGKRLSGVRTTLDTVVKELETARKENRATLPYLKTAATEDELAASRLASNKRQREDSPQPTQEP